MPRIEIDDEIYKLLEDNVRGFEQPNAVLRRLLLRPPTPSAKSAAMVTSGRLAKLIEAGLVSPGDRLEHRQVRKGTVYSATVGAGGTIETELGVYAAPSPALADLVGSQIDGWHNWYHEPSARTLRQLRSGLDE